MRGCARTDRGRRNNVGNGDRDKRSDSCTWRCCAGGLAGGRGRAGRSLARNPAVPSGDLGARCRALCDDARPGHGQPDRGTDRRQLQLVESDTVRALRISPRRALRRTGRRNPPGDPMADSRHTRHDGRLRAGRLHHQCALVGRAHAARGRGGAVSLGITARGAGYAPRPWGACPCRRRRVRELGRCVWPDTGSDLRFHPRAGCRLRSLPDGSSSAGSVVGLPDTPG